MRSDLKKIGEQKSTYLVGQTERALYLLDVISTITDRGNNAEVRRKKDGTLTVYGNRQIMMRPDIKLPQPFASWSNSL